MIHLFGNWIKDPFYPRMHKCRVVNYKKARRVWFFKSSSVIYTQFTGGIKNMNWAEKKIVTFYISFEFQMMNV